MKWKGVYVSKCYQPFKHYSLTDGTSKGFIRNHQYHKTWRITHGRLYFLKNFCPPLLPNHWNDLQIWKEGVKNDPLFVNRGLNTVLYIKQFVFTPFVLSDRWVRLPKRNRYGTCAPQSWKKLWHWIHVCICVCRAEPHFVMKTVLLYMIQVFQLWRLYNCFILIVKFICFKIASLYQNRT